MRTAIDTNLISAIWTGEPSGSRGMNFLSEAESLGSLVISPIVYIELCGYPGASADLIHRFLNKTRITVDWRFELDIWQAAAERFQRYTERRRRQGLIQPKRLLADFLVGTHALLRAERFATLDQRIYRTDFPELSLAEI